MEPELKKYQVDTVYIYQLEEHLNYLHRDGFEIIKIDQLFAGDRGRYVIVARRYDV